MGKGGGQPAALGSKPLFSPGAWWPQGWASWLSGEPGRQAPRAGHREGGAPIAAAPGSRLSRRLVITASVFERPAMISNMSPQLPVALARWLSLHSPARSSSVPGGHSLPAGGRRHRCPRRNRHCPSVPRGALTSSGCRRPGPALRAPLETRPPPFARAGSSRPPPGTSHPAPPPGDSDSHPHPACPPPPDSRCGAQLLPQDLGGPGLGGGYFKSPALWGSQH